MNTGEIRDSVSNGMFLLPTLELYFTPFITVKLASPFSILISNISNCKAGETFVGGGKVPRIWLLGPPPLLPPWKEGICS